MHMRKRAILGTLLAFAVVLMIACSQKRPKPVQAIMDNNITMLRRLIASDPGIVTNKYYTERSESWTLLEFATANRNTNAMRVLLAAGANPDQRGQGSLS